MPTPIEIAQKLAVHFMKATYKDHALKHIMIEINCLHYSQLSQPLEYEKKIVIVKLIESYITDPRCLKIFQRYKPSLLKRFNDDVYLKEKNDTQEYFIGEQFKGLMAYVLQKTNAHFPWLNKRG